MQASPFLCTLLTDFGWKDSYVAQMKGVLYAGVPGISLVDLTHEIAPQDVEQASDFLAETWSWYPEGTLHMAVVDPGVGSDRRILGASCKGHWFLAPDNGLLDFLFATSAPFSVFALNTQKIGVAQASSTFHGRDIFAPAAICIAAGKDLGMIGNPVDKAGIRRLHRRSCSVAEDGTITGSVLRADGFGNLITDIPGDWVSDTKTDSVRVLVGDRLALNGLSSHYAAVAKGEPVVLLDSQGRIEIALRDGNFAATFGVRAGDPVVIGQKTDDANDISAGPVRCENDRWRR